MRKHLKKHLLTVCLEIAPNMLFTLEKHNHVQTEINPVREKHALHVERMCDVSKINFCCELCAYLTVKFMCLFSVSLKCACAGLHRDYRIIKITFRISRSLRHYQHFGYDAELGVYLDPSGLTLNAEGVSSTWAGTSFRDLEALLRTKAHAWSARTARSCADICMSVQLWSKFINKKYIAFRIGRL